MLPTKTKTMSQTDVAYDQLKAKIIAGEFHPGDQVDAIRISEDLGLGRTPVREALLRLQNEGIVKIIPKRGVRILSLSADDLTDIYQVISAVEVEALRLICEAKPPAHKLLPLDDAVRCMAEAASANNREDWAHADERFHRQLLELCPNKRLRDVGITHRDLAQRSHFVALRLLTQDQRAKSAEQHGILLDQIRTGEIATAVESHRRQRARGSDMLVCILREHQLTRL